MNLYTHFVLATRLAHLFRPQNQADYAWGSIAPDIRYLAGLPRSQTHLTKEMILANCERYPHLHPFLQGYLVHCTLDEIDLSRVLGAAFPINLLGHLLRKKFSSQEMAVLVELYYLKTAHLVGEISGAANEMLVGMGITSDQTRDFAAAARDYLSSPSFDTAFAAFRRMGLIEDARVERYLNAYQSLYKNPLLLNLLFLAVKNARLEGLAEQRLQPLIGF